MSGKVVAVHRNPAHTFSKMAVDAITLLEGRGVEGDAHCGVTVQHRSRVAADPSQPNLRQVHLIHDELFETVRAAGHDVRPGDLGENITTHGIDLLGLPVGTRLHVGDAVITIMGLRNPCQQIEAFGAAARPTGEPGQDGLLKQVVYRDDQGVLTRLAGIMGIVARGGQIGPGDAITVELPAPPHLPLTRV